MDGIQKDITGSNFGKRSSKTLNRSAGYDDGLVKITGKAEAVIKEQPLYNFNAR